MRGAFDINRPRYRALPLAVALAFLIVPFATAQSADLAATEAGARYGQARGVERHCPGGHLTAAATDLSNVYRDADRLLFDREADKVTQSWDAAFSCRDVDPETRRVIASCRRIKLLSCRQAWIEIGPQGSIIPGLVELSPTDQSGESADGASPSPKSR